MDKKGTNLIQGFNILKLHYSADPEKDEKWVEEAKKAMDSETWTREMELTPVGHDGNYPVFGDYKKARHEADTIRWDKTIPTIIRGWDFGKVHPCVEFVQIKGLEKNVIGEVYGNNIYLGPFIEEVFTYGELNFPGSIYVDWVDATGKNERDNGLPSIRVMQNYGLKPKWRMQEIEEGLSYITKELITSTNSGRPYIMINPKMCPHLSEAMRGGYQRKKDGTVNKDGKHDHPVDAFRYAISGYLTGVRRTESQYYSKLKNYKYKPHNPHTGY